MIYGRQINTFFLKTNRKSIGNINMIKYRFRAIVSRGIVSYNTKTAASLFDAAVLVCVMLVRLVR